MNKLGQNLSFEIERKYWQQFHDEFSESRDALRPFMDIFTDAGPHPVYTRALLLITNQTNNRIWKS